MNEARTWLRGLRYSRIDLAVFLLLTAGSISVGTYWTAVTCVRRAYAQAEGQRRIIAEAAFVTPLPQVVIAPEPLSGRVFQKEYALTRDWVTRYAALWHAVYQPFQGKPGVKYLEIGAFEGASVVWMLENVLTDSTSQATAIDVFDGPYKDTYRANIELSGGANKVTTLTGFSQVVLRGLPLDSFDIIYIDGSHAKNDVLEDAALCWRLLKANGLMVFDDYRTIGKGLNYSEGVASDDLWYPKPAIDAFVQCFDRQCEVIHNGEQLIVRKKV